MNTNIIKTWTITITESEVLARCTNESLYQAYVRADANTKGDAMAIQEDDMDVFRLYYGNALAELQMLLARRMEEMPVHTNLSCEFTLQMHHNHDNNILPVLINHCYGFVVKRVLEQWYHIDFGAELEKLEINHCIHYRKHPVRRTIGPLF